MIAGSASGALTGLLFVAVSLNRDRLAGHPALQSQAGVTLVLFLLPLITSMVLVIPGTPSWVLGLELVTIAIASAVIMGVISPGKPPEGDEPEAVLARLLARFSPNLLTMLLILVAGAIELAGADGLYWLAPALIAALVTGVAKSGLLDAVAEYGFTSFLAQKPRRRNRAIDPVEELGAGWDDDGRTSDDKVDEPDQVAAEDVEGVSAWSPGGSALTAHVDGEHLKSLRQGRHGRLVGPPRLGRRWDQQQRRRARIAEGGVVHPDLTEIDRVFLESVRDEDVLVVRRLETRLMPTPRPSRRQQPTVSMRLHRQDRPCRARGLSGTP